MRKRSVSLKFVFSAHAEVVPCGGVNSTRVGCILRARGGSSRMITAAEFVEFVFSAHAEVVP